MNFIIHHIWDVIPTPLANSIIFQDGHSQHHQPVMAVQNVGILNSRGENQADEGAIPGAVFVMGFLG